MLGNRLQQIMDYYHLNPVSFSEKLQIQRSSLSHFFTGRNKPGWEFLEKMARTFPEINIQWLLTGSGKMLTVSESTQQKKVLQQAASLFPEDTLPTDVDKGKISIEQVIILYSNGTCKLYRPDRI